RYLALGGVTLGLLCAAVGVAALVLASHRTDTRRGAEATAPDRVGRLFPKAPSPGETWANAIGMKFAWIPPGQFRMGSDKYDDEKPAHWVTITKGFYMGVYPVTQAEWQE